MIEFKPSDFFYPVPLLRTYWLLRRSEHWCPAQFASYQGKLLARLLAFCSTEVPHYRSLLRQAGVDANGITAANAMDALKRLPVLDKDTVREHPEDFLAQDAGRFRPKAITTSGTTGTPLTVYWDRGSNVLEFCCIQRLWRWAGIRVGQPFLDLRSRIFESDGKKPLHQGAALYLRNWKANGLEFSSDFIDDSTIADYHQLLMQYRPRLVRGHPQAIQHLARLLHKHGLDTWRPTAVTTASETLYEFQRREIEELWGVPILDSYGLKEHNVFITQCREGSYDIYPEYGICEILDDHGCAVGPGQEGWIVATGLWNYAQPLLRYNTRDRAVPSNGQPCSCGRTLPTVARIIGRIDDCIYTVDGKRFSGMHFAFFGRRGIKKARLVQEEYDRTSVELVATPEFDGAERAALLDALQAKVNGAIRFDLRLMDDITQDTPGKFKFVVCRVKAPAEEMATLLESHGGNVACRYT